MIITSFFNSILIISSHVTWAKVMGALLRKWGMMDTLGRALQVHKYTYIHVT